MVLKGKERRSKEEIINTKKEENTKEEAINKWKKLY